MEPWGLMTPMNLTCIEQNGIEVLVLPLEVPKVLRKPSQLPI